MDDRSASSAARSPLPLDDSDPMHTINILQRDNETLRSMLRRALGPATAKVEQGVSTATHHLQSQLAKRDDECRRERERRTIAESLLAELRHDRDMSLKAKDADIRKLQDAVTHLKSENSTLLKRSTDDRHVIDILKKENHRLLELVQNKAPSGTQPSNISGVSTSRGPSSYAALVRPERLRADVPSAKHMNPLVVKRSFLPSAGTAGLRSTSPCPSTTPSTTRKTSTVAANAARGVGGATRGDPQMTAIQSSRPKSAGSSVVGGATRPRAAATYEVGQRCTWHRMQGVVRYVGPVQGLGRGQLFVGIELLIRGSGDHDGTLGGVQYFAAAPRSAVFCVASELQPPSDSRTSTPKRTTSSSSGCASRAGVNPLRRCADVPEPSTEISPIRKVDDDVVEVTPSQPQPEDSARTCNTLPDAELGAVVPAAEAEAVVEDVPEAFTSREPLACDDDPTAVGEEASSQLGEGLPAVDAEQQGTPTECDGPQTEPLQDDDILSAATAADDQGAHTRDDGSLVRTDNEDVRFCSAVEGTSSEPTLCE